ncbi:MAG: hypothetical protein GY882_01645 [Actinomycetia bacterium]|nr:hypothetical protein [Actinomycetes bacterium]MCP4844874.1 hypothetical protein [Actinomycetes bacterium]
MSLPDPTKAVTDGNMAGALGGILDAFGVKPSQTRCDLESIVVEELAACGISADVAEVRWGTLVLVADPHNAELLKWHLDALLAAVSARRPGEVEAVEVKVRR